MNVSLEEEFNHYIKSAYTYQLSPRQLVEVKRAFFAGAAVAFFGLMKSAINSDEGCMSDCMKDIDDELHAFKDSVEAQLQ